MLLQAIKGETDGLREELEFVRTLGADLIFACGETEKPEVKKTIDEVRSLVSHDRTWSWGFWFCKCIISYSSAFLKMLSFIKI